MKNRREFLKTGAAAGIAGILSSRTAPAFCQDMGMMKIGQLGLGGHGFLKPFKNPPKKFTGKVRCKPYAVWDNTPGVAEAMMDMGFEKIIRDPEQLVKESDAVHVEHADYRKAFELARPALEAGKPVYFERPFAYTIADAEEIIRLAKANNAPVMAGSSLEYQPEVLEMQKFARESGPLRSYEAFCPEPVFPWMFPHVINYAHAGLGGGIETAYFAGDYLIDVSKWVHIKQALMGTLDLTKFPQGYKPDYKNTTDAEKRPIGEAVSILTFKSRDGQPPMIGYNHIGEDPGTYHVTVYGMGGAKTFTAGDDLFDNMFLALHAFYSTGKPPRPYEAILEQHRALVATNVSRLTGRAVRLDSLGGSDSLPWHDELREYLVRFRLKKIK
ncbi:MAG: Gfo/Idh/MocA family oxidoreductase [Candidatus Latescibacterota bacterium]